MLCTCRKKKKNKAKEVVKKIEETATDSSATEASTVRTKAELAFEKVQEKRVNDCKYKIHWFNGRKRTLPLSCEKFFFRDH